MINSKTKEKKPISIVKKLLEYSRLTLENNMNIKIEDFGNTDYISMLIDIKNSDTVVNLAPFAKTANAFQDIIHRVYLLVEEKKIVFELYKFQNKKNKKKKREKNSNNKNESTDGTSEDESDEGEGKKDCNKKKKRKFK